MCSWAWKKTGSSKSFQWSHLGMDSHTYTFDCNKHFLLLLFTVYILMKLFSAITRGNTCKYFFFQLKNTPFHSSEGSYYFLPSLFKSCNRAFLYFSMSQGQTAGFSIWAISKVIRLQACESTGLTLIPQAHDELLELVEPVVTQDFVFQ